MPDQDQCDEFDLKIAHTDTKIDTMQRDFHNHIRELRVDLSEHISEQHQRHSEILESQRLNTDAITSLANSTQGLIDAWSTANATVRAVSVVGRVVKWVAGVVLAVGAVIALVKGGFNS